MRKEIPKGETYNKYGDAARKVEIGAIGKHGAFKMPHFSEIPEAGSLIEGLFAHTVQISRFRPVVNRPELMLVKIENRTIDFA